MIKLVNLLQPNEEKCTLLIFYFAKNKAKKYFKKSRKKYWQNEKGIVE